MNILKLFSIHKTASNALMILIILFGYFWLD